MTQSKRDWTMQVHRAAMEIVGICGLLSVRAPSDSIEAQRGDRAAVKALTLAQEAMNRIHAAVMAADQDAIQAGDYDLNFLATAPASAVKE